ncbi:MAG: type II secretion system F family protein, partial [Bacillota bacterium]|nr:type II secretion system F family protein [Bacillota bacterium]
HGIAVPIRKIGIFPSLLIHMISVGENTGELDEMLTRTAGFFDEEVEEAVEKLTAMIEPIMIVLLASIVAVVILSIMLPLLSIMSTVK